MLSNIFNKVLLLQNVDRCKLLIKSNNPRVFNNVSTDYRYHE